MDNNKVLLQYIASLSNDLYTFSVKADKTFDASNLTHQELILHYKVARDKAYALSSAMFDLKNQDSYEEFNKNIRKGLIKVTGNKQTDLVASANKILLQEKYSEQINSVLKEYGFDPSSLKEALENLKDEKIFIRKEKKLLIISIQENDIMSIDTGDNSNMDFSIDEYAKDFNAFGRPLYAIANAPLPKKTNLDFDRMVFEFSTILIHYFDSNVRVIEDLGAEARFKGKEGILGIISNVILIVGAVLLISGLITAAAGHREIGGILIAIGGILIALGVGGRVVDGFIEHGVPTRGTPSIMCMSRDFRLGLCSTRPHP